MTAPDPSPHVLVVDDQADAADTLAELLALSGFAVRTVYSNAAALAAVASGFEPHAVVADLRSADGDGCDLAAELRRRLPRPPVLVAVSWMSGQAARCRAAGFDHYLLKPADPRAVVELLRRETHRG
jgi:CheY-like chemotaxis protein